jgi:hypothetical protein
MERQMSMFKLPLSGDVVQSISPMTWWASPIGSQFGLVNISVGQSSAPEVEADVLSKVAGYGQQLGILGDALAVLIRRLPKDARLSAEDQHAVKALTDLLDEVAKVKEKHGRKALRL